MSRPFPFSSAAHEPKPTVSQCSICRSRNRSDSARENPRPNGWRQTSGSAKTEARLSMSSGDHGRSTRRSVSTALTATAYGCSGERPRACSTPGVLGLAPNRSGGCAWRSPPSSRRAAISQSRRSRSAARRLLRFPLLDAFPRARRRLGRDVIPVAVVLVVSICALVVLLVPVANLTAPIMIARVLRQLQPPELLPNSTS